VVAPAVNLGLASLPPERLKYASGLFNMMRNLGGAVGIAVCSAIINAKTNFHFVAIASNLTPANGAMTRLLDDLTQRYGAILGSLQAGHTAALKQLWELAYREGIDAGLCRRVPRHYVRVRCCYAFGSVAPQCRCLQA
jgi:DHA2 family multidrug resistance protein